MSTPVVTSKWAGSFDCDFCKRKRLVGSAFSNKALDKYRKNGNPLKCKQCVAELEAKERAVAAAKKTNSNQDKEGSDETKLCTCASCKKSLSSSHYNRNQLAKGEGKSRCRSCVEKAIANEAKQTKDAKEAKIENAKERVRLAEQKGNFAELVKAEAELSALEAEIVTGLKPKILRGRKARGGTTGRGRGRGIK